jgi:hypothetical protein
MATPSTGPGKLILEPNVPQLIALKYRTGKECSSLYKEEKQVYYTLTDGRGLYVDLAVSNAINNLKLGVAEPFHICKYWNGDKKQKPRLNVWYTVESERQRAADEAIASRTAAEPSYLEPQLAASIVDAQERRRPPQAAQGAPPPQGTGTNGPIAVPSRMPEQARPMPAPTTAASTGHHQAPATSDSSLTSWGQYLLTQTTGLIDVYAAACLHAEEQGVPSVVVRAMMISAYIGMQKTGGGR